MEKKMNSSNGFRTQLSILISLCSLFFAFILFLIPNRYVDESLEPTLYHALLFAVLLAFAAASSTLLIGIGNPSRHATTQTCYFIISALSLASALLLLACALFLEIFRRLVSPGFKLWQLNQSKADTEVVCSYVFQVFRKILPASQSQEQ
ncbi:hypothetical protein WN944_016045 [Citrus x changshan-huyou]|uniref:Uncharacterized protein n=1 Tax=Citrus x changshan-huyou TaxID=2935761 RepID=A0AAP0MCY6_9ROSI